MKPSEVLGYLRDLTGMCGARGASLFLLQWVLGRKTIRTRIRGIPTTLFVRRFDSDVHVLREIFVVRELDIPLEDPPRTIVDAGAYVGYSTVFFARRYPEARVVAIEPDPGNYELLKWNCREYPNVQTLRAGLWTSHADLKIENPTSRSWALRLSEALSGELDSVRGVPVAELPGRFDRKQIDILKIDIEGAEERLFSSRDRDWLRAVRTVIVEIHGEACREAVFRAMSERHVLVAQKGEKLVFARRGRPL